MKNKEVMTVFVDHIIWNLYFVYHTKLWPFWPKIGPNQAKLGGGVIRGFYV